MARVRSLEKARIRRMAPTAVVVAAALIAPLVAGATLAIVAASQSPLESAAEAAPLIGTIESAERSEDVQVAIAVEFAPTPVVVAPTSGVVTSMHFAVGDEVSTGTRLVTINDRDLVAYSSAAPLYRDISRGETGRDVSTAQELLSALGFAPGAVDGRAGWATERAIIAFNKAHGYGPNNAVLSLGSLGWIGTGPVTVGSAKTVLGMTVSQGDAIFEGVASAVAIMVTEPPALPSDAPLELVVSGTMAAYEPGSGRISDATSVAAIAAIVGTATDRPGTLRLVDPVRVGAVPASSVVTDSTGASCIFADVEGKPLPIQPLGGSLGTVDIDASLIGEPLLLNPREVRSDLSCVVS